MNPNLLAANAALTEGRRSEAADLMIAGLSVEPNCASRQIFANLLNLLLELRRYREGADWAAKAVAIGPKDYEFLNLYGSFLRLTDRQIEALPIFDRAIRVRPADIPAQINKAHTYNDLKRGSAAETIFAKLARQHPKLPGLHRAWARALSAQQKFSAAEIRLRQAIGINRQDVDAWLDLSATASDQSDGDKAISVLDTALELLPSDPRLLRAKAILLRHLGRMHEAEALLILALKKLGSSAWLYHELGQTIIDEAPDRALACLRKAVELAPRIEYRLTLAEALVRSPNEPAGRYIDEAYALLAELPATAKLSPVEIKTFTEILTRVADFERVARLGSFSEIGRLWASSSLHAALLGHLPRVAQPADRQELIAQHRMWGDKMLARAKLNPVVRPQSRRQSSKIRLGFMSSDLREHPVSYFAWPLFEHIDRDRFEIYCYSYYRGPASGRLQDEIASISDMFRLEPTIGDRDAAQAIANDHLDILFELGGSTHMNKLEVLAWKPAPIAVSWLGYPHSAGLSNIDYLLVDPHLAPPDPSLLIEQPLVMPKSWIAMSDRAFPDLYGIDPLAPFQRNGFITFGTANSPYKYNPEMLRTWARVMRMVLGSRFIFLRPEGGSQTFIRNILRHFELEGIVADRIEFRPIRAKHMPHYNAIDIALDTFPQTGGTTTCEAAWMGVPTVTLVGEALFERLSYSILQNAGLGDLCASTTDEFIEIATRLASDTDRIQALRTGLRDEIKAGPLGQTERFARDFYDLVHRAVEAHTGIADNANAHRSSLADDPSVSAANLSAERG